MTSWIPFYRSNDTTTKDVIRNFEKDLNKLSNSINELNLKITLTSKRLNKVKRQFIVYSIIAFLSYLLYLGLIVRFKNCSTLDIIYLTVIPCLISIISKLITFIYGKKVSYYEKKIESLQSKHQSKIDELKDVTNFNKTRDLLKKYSDDEINSLQQQEEFFQKLEIPQLPPLPPTREPGLLDRVLNLIIGEDEYVANKRYALICEKCLVHNGLAPPGMLAKDVKYICSNCGTLNGKDNDIDKEDVVEDKEDKGEEDKKDKKDKKD